MLCKFAACSQLFDQSITMDRRHFFSLRLRAPALNRQQYLLHAQNLIAFVATRLTIHSLAHLFMPQYNRCNLHGNSICSVCNWLNTFHFENKKKTKQSLYTVEYMYKSLERRSIISLFVRLSVFVYSIER